MQIEALQSILDDYGVDGDQFPPELVAPALQGLAFAWPNDQSAGFDTAREAASAAMDRLLDGLTARRAVRMPPASRT